MCSGSRHHFADVGKMGWSLVWAVEPGGLVGQGFDGSRMPLRGGMGELGIQSNRGDPTPAQKILIFQDIVLKWTLVTTYQKNT